MSENPLDQFTTEQMYIINDLMIQASDSEKARIREAVKKLDAMNLVDATDMKTPYSFVDIEKVLKIVDNDHNKD